MHQIKYMSIDMKLKEQKINPSFAPSQTKLEKLKISNDALAKKENALSNIAEILAHNLSDMVTFSSSVTPLDLRLSTGNSSGNNNALEQKDIFQRIYSSAAVPDEYVNEKTRELYATTIRNTKSELGDIEQRYLKNSTKIQQLSWELSVRSNLVARLANKAEEARMLVSEKTTDIRWVSKAIQPHFPIGPDVFKITVFGALFGFFAAIMLCIFIEMIQIAEARQKNQTTDS